jgi:hypothetical protein
MRSAIASLAPRFPLAVAGLVFAAAIVPAACQPTPLPGDMLGMYKVTAQSTTNSCGAGLGAPDPWVFDAQVSVDGTTVYWSFMDGNAPLSGLMASATKASITSDQTANVDSSDAGAGPCTLARADDIEMTLGSGSPPTSLSGTISYSFTVPGGSDCGDQLASGGGSYSALPCTIAYSMTAQRQ